MLPSVYELMAQDCIMYALPLSSSPFWGSSSWDNWISESSFLKLLAVSTLHLFKLFKHLSSFNSITRKVKENNKMSSMAGTMSLQRVYIYVISALSEIHLIQRTSLPVFHTKLYIQKLESFFSNFERALLFSTESSLQGCFCWQLGKLYVLLSPARES